MKKVMMMLLMVGFVLTVQAQPGKRGSKPENEKERMEKAKTHLELTDEQFEKWKAVHEKYGDEVKSLRDERTEEKEKGEALREKIDSELEAILTDEQKEKFAEVKKKGPERRKPRGKKPGGQ